MKSVLLTFDVEEFDADREKDFELSGKGLMNILNLLAQYQIKATFFTTAAFAKTYPNMIRQMSEEGHEIACHGYDHEDSYFTNLEKIGLAKEEIEEIIGKPVKGFRAPRLEIKSILDLENYGFEYDSSLHPIWLPGRYNNFGEKRGVHRKGNLIEIPISTLPPNLSIFWLAFKNFPLAYSKLFTKLTKDYTMLVFHSWEFNSLRGKKAPFYIKRLNGRGMLNKLDRYIRFCKKQGYKFDTIRNYLNMKSFK